MRGQNPKWGGRTPPTPPANRTLSTAQMCRPEGHLCSPEPKNVQSRALKNGLWRCLCRSASKKCLKNFKILRSAAGVCNGNGTITKNMYRLYLFWGGYRGSDRCQGGLKPTPLGAFFGNSRVGQCVCQGGRTSPTPLSISALELWEIEELCYIVFNA